MSSFVKLFCSLQAVLPMRPDEPHDTGDQQRSDDGVELVRSHERQFSP